MTSWTPLPDRARLLFHVQALSGLMLFWVPTTGFGTAALAVSWKLLPALGLGAAWLLVRVVIALWVPSLAYERWAWAERDEDLLISHGVLFRTITAIPTSRIQHVDTRQGPLEQWLGLARVQIYTASGMGADGVIPGLELDVAEALRDRLVRAEGDDGV